MLPTGFLCENPFSQILKTVKKITDTIRTDTDTIYSLQLSWFR